VSESSIPTRNPSAGDERDHGKRWLDALKRLALQVTPSARKQFARELSLELTRAGQGGVWLEQQSQYLVVESAEMHDLPLWRDITIECRLVETPDSNRPVDVVELSSKPVSDEAERRSVRLMPGQSAGGERHYHFTFRSSIPVRENMNQFRLFLTNSFVSPEDTQREFLRRRLDLIEAHNAAKKAGSHE
jgi:hypothetical protein